MSKSSKTQNNRLKQVKPGVGGATLHYTPYTSSVKTSSKTQNNRLKQGNTGIVLYTPMKSQAKHMKNRL